MKIELLAFSAIWLGLSCFTGSLAAQTPLTVTASAAPLQCSGDVNGELSWEVSGGVAPYTYAWSRQNNAFVFAAGSQMNPGAFGPVTGSIGADVYILEITDAAGVEVSTTVELLSPAPIQVTAIDVVPLTCAELCDGAILMEVGGGTGELTINWNDDPLATSPNRNDMCTGEYLFQLVDENGCSQKGIVPVEGPAPLTLTAAALPTSCAGGGGGNLSTVPAGGTGAYGFNWSTGAEGADLQNVVAGSYGLTLTDENNCTLDTLLNVPEGLPFLANPQIDYGCGDGRILLRPQPINGTLPYNYSWSTGQQTPFLYGATAGTYGLTLTDAQGCVASESIEVAFVSPLAVTVGVTDVSCHGAQDGAVSLGISGGMPPFVISWNSGQTGAAVSNLSGGDYTFNLSAAGCGEARVINVYEPSAITADISFVLQTDGLLTASAASLGGSPPYLYAWSNGANTSVATGLQPGQLYQLTITDATGCSQTLDVLPTLTGTSDLTEPEFIVFPNPTSGPLQVKASTEDITAYRVFRGDGRLVLDWQVYPLSGNIDLSQQSSGVYLLQLQSGDQIGTVRVVVF